MEDIINAMEKHGYLQGSTYRGRVRMEPDDLVDLGISRDMDRVFIPGLEPGSRERQGRRH